MLRVITAGGAAFGLGLAEVAEGEAGKKRCEKTLKSVALLTVACLDALLGAIRSAALPMT